MGEDITVHIKASKFYNYDTWRASNKYPILWRKDVSILSQNFISVAWRYTLFLFE